jgi:hypothetical protein
MIALDYDVVVPVNQSAVIPETLCRVRYRVLSTVCICSIAIEFGVNVVFNR